MKAALLVAALGACVSSSSVQCEDGTFCPSATECAQLTDPATTVCASHDQVAACAGMPDGTACSTQPGSQCRDGVCWPFRCGDARLDPGEACDDGNTLDGDGCSSTCASTEVCGNGIADPVRRVVQTDGTVAIVPLEQCDDGNFADHDGCNTHCELETPQWTLVAPSGPAATPELAMTYDATHAEVVLFGGSPAGTWRWDGASWLSTSPLTAPSERSGDAMAYDADTRRVVLFGGSTNSGIKNDTWEWDGTTWTERTMAAPPTVRSAASVAYDGARKRIVMFGGSYVTPDPDQGPVLDDTYEWDGTQWVAMLPATSPPGRSAAALAYDPVHGVVVMFGGGGSMFRGIGSIFADTWTYDGVTWTEQTPATAPPPRESAMMAWDPVSQRIVLYGGAGPNNTTLQDMWSWDGTTWSLISATNPPGQLDGAGIAADPVRGRVVMFGGGVSATWEWSGTAWTNVTPGAPPQQAFHEVAFDAPRGRAVMFDGTEAVESNGPNWMISSVAAPGLRTGAALAYDARRGVTVLFGGAARFDIVQNDTWTWNGAVWMPQTVAAPPPARSGGQMVFDRATDQIVLFGGIDASGAALADTWLWDGASWQAAAPVHSPSPRVQVAFGYDDKRQRAILYGGTDANGTILGDTWSWDGHDWTELPTATQPGPLADASLSWHAQRGHLVLFGGALTPGDVTSNAWEWDGAAWVAIEATNPPAARSSASQFAAPHGIYVAGGATGLSSGGDVWLLEWDSTRVEESCHLDVDDDGDGQKGCADPDCGYLCTPSCVGLPPAAGMKTCDDTLPHCGDGVCNPALETCRNCPGDCTCTAVCGDAFCDAPETHASCPGDCP